VATLDVKLFPGDVLLYSRGGFYGWLIKHKTASPFTHTETYIGDGLTAASRNGKGVNSYEFDPSGLALVLRPNLPHPEDFPAGLKWHNSCIGQGYDWLGVFRAFLSPLGRGNIGRQWCSEHTARFAKKSGYFPFGQAFDSEKVAPADFLKSPDYTIVWAATVDHQTEHES